MLNSLYHLMSLSACTHKLISQIRNQILGKHYPVLVSDLFITLIIFLIIIFLICTDEIENPFLTTRYTATCIIVPQWKNFVDIKEYSFII